MKKKRTYESSELVKTFAKIHGFEDKLLAFEVKDFLKNYLDTDLFQEIDSINMREQCLFIKIKSPLLKNNFRMQRSFFLKKFQSLWGASTVRDLQIL